MSPLASSLEHGPMRREKKTLRRMIAIYCGHLHGFGSPLCAASQAFV